MARKENLKQVKSSVSKKEKKSKFEQVDIEDRDLESGDNPEERETGM